MITFSKKLYTCSSCGYKGVELLAIKYNRELETGYPTSGKPEHLKNKGIYFEQINRDAYGIVTLREARERQCENCGCFTLEANHVDNEENVLNFYPPSIAGQWSDGFAKAGL